jgi:hypothetical protein
MIGEIAAISLDDGVIFDTATASAETIRDEDRYRGVRVSMTASLATARLAFHVDVSAGDPLIPSPHLVRLPRILDGQITLRGYPLAMVHAEKIVTAIARGSTSTRWRDFADLYLLALHHPIDGAELSDSIRHVAQYRRTTMVPLAETLKGYAAIGQQRWDA